MGQWVSVSIVLERKSEELSLNPQNPCKSDSRISVCYCSDSTGRWEAHKGIVLESHELV